MKIVKFITGVSRKLAKAESWRLPSKDKALPALPAPPIDEERPEVKPVVVEKDEEKAEEVKLELVVEEAPIQPTTKLEPIQEPKPPGRRKALLIGIQFYPDPAAEARQEPPAAPSVPPLPSSSTASTAAAAAATQDTAARTTPSLAASSSLASITSRAKAKFMQTMSISSPLASASSLPSSSASPPPPPLLAGARKKSYAAAVSPRAGLSSAPSAWPALGSAAPASSPTAVTPRTGGVTPAPPTKVPLKPGRSLIQQQQKSFTEKTAKKEKEKEKQKEKKKRKKEKEQSAHQHERSTSSAQSYALKGCHRDVQEMQKMLVDLYGYSPSDITTMIDTPANVDSKSSLLPTRENIIKQIQELVKGAVEGDRFFFFFAGHSTQEETDSLDEEDGKDELIVTYDNDLIRDDELRKMLVAPLPPGVKLTAVFDSCHSASLLDLDHFRCNRTWVPWKNKGRRRSLSRLNAVVRKAAAPLSPRRSSAWFNSPISTANPLYPLIIDLDRIKRAVSRKRRRDAAAIQANDSGQALEEAKKSEAEELEKAQERAREVLSDSLGNVPGASATQENPDTATANPSAGKENVKPRRREPPIKRGKIIPPPVYEGWRKSSLDRVMAGGASGRGSGSSEVAPPSATAARPISILASGTSAAIIAGRTNAPSSDGPPAAQAAKRPKIKLPPIRTTSLHPGDVPTQPVTPVTNANAAYVTFTPQTYTPQSSRRDSVVVSRRDSVSLAHQLGGARRESGQAGVVPGMSQVLEEAFAKRANRQKGDTQLTDRTDRTDMTDKTDRSDGTYPASDVSHDSGVFWLVDEPDEIGEPEEEGEEPMGSAQGQDPSVMSSLGATAFLAMGEAPTTTTMAGHAISSAAAASGSKSVPVRATSLLKPKTKGAAAGDKAKKKKRHPRRCLSPEERFCTGWCRKQYEEEGVDGKKVMPFVISLSAAKDGQQAWEDASGASMTQHLVAILRKDPAPSLEKLLGLISHDLHATYLDIHSSAREYRKKAREVNKKLLSKGKEMREVAAVEMNNFQDPQVSSLWPLDMKNEVWDP